MCATCNTINKQLDTEGAPLDATKTEKALADIATAIKKGRSYSHFEKVTNRLLGTDMAPRDSEVEQRWEKGYRDRSSE